LLVEGSLELRGRRVRTCSLRGCSLREGLHELLDLRVRSKALLARSKPMDALSRRGTPLEYLTRQRVAGARVFGV